MAFTVSNPYGTGTDAEILEFLRGALVSVVMHGWYRMADGRTVQHATPDQLQKVIDVYEAKVAAASTTTAQATNHARRMRTA